MSLFLPCLVFAHLFPSGFHYGQDSSDKAVRSGERGREGEREREAVEILPQSILMHDGKEGRKHVFIS